MRDGLDTWRTWYTDRDNRYKEMEHGVEYIKSEEELKMEEEIKGRVRQISQRLEQQSTNESVSDTGTVEYHNQSDEELNSARKTEEDDDQVEQEEDSRLYTPRPPTVDTKQLLMKSKTPDVLVPANLPPRPLYWSKASGQKALQQISDSMPKQLLSRQRDKRPGHTNIPPKDIEVMQQTLPDNNNVTLLPQSDQEDMQFYPDTNPTEEEEREEELELESESQFLEQLPNRFGQSGRPQPQKKIILKKLFRDHAPAMPNTRPIDKQTRTVRTVSMAQQDSILKLKQTLNTTGRNSQLLPLKATATLEEGIMAEDDMATVQDLNPDSAHLKIYPASINFGYLAVGEIYRCSAMLTNVGHLPGRFIVKHFNKSAWTASYINTRRKEQEILESTEDIQSARMQLEAISQDTLEDNILKVICKNGPIAPGMTVKIEIEIHAAKPQSLSHVIQVNTEHHFISLPVRATVMSQSEFIQNKHALNKRVKIVNLNPVVNKL
jgi:hypothetical protein